VGWAFVAEAVGGGWVAYMIARAEALAIALISEGCQLYVEALRVWPILYRCIAFLLCTIGLLTAF
jgi:hypothetical protein